MLSPQPFFPIGIIPCNLQVVNNHVKDGFSLSWRHKRPQTCFFIAADLQRSRNPGEAEIALCCANLCLCPWHANSMRQPCHTYAIVHYKAYHVLQKKNLDGYMVADGTIEAWGQF